MPHFALLSLCPIRQFYLSHRKSIPAISLLILLALTGGAQAADPVQGAEEMSEIVVTATRYELQVSKVPANVSVITEQAIANSTAQNIPDLLRSEVGLKVTDLTGNNRNFTVDIRGFGERAGSNTLVLVDGRRVNQADLSDTDWLQIPLQRVERIEIIRGGSGSVLYGDNASGGVINIITKEGDRFQTAVSGAVGSYETYQSDAALSGREGPLTFALSGDTLTSDGYRDNSDLRAKDAGLNLAYLVHDRARLYLKSGYHKDDTSLPGALFRSDFANGLSRTDTTHPDDFAEVKDYYVQGGPEFYFGGDSLFKIDGSYRNRESDSFASGSWGRFTGNTEIDTVVVSPQVLVKLQLGGIRNTLTLGYDYENIEEEIWNDSIFFGEPSLGDADLKKEEQGYYVHDELVLTDRLTFSGGYRRDKADFDFRSRKEEIVMGMPRNSLTDTDTTTRESAVTGGFNYRYGQKSYAYVSGSKGFRYPLFDEFFNFGPNTLDENLKPQTTKSYEVGLRHYFSENGYAHLNLFQLDTEKEIFFNPVLFSNENMAGKTRRAGAELSFVAQPVKGLAVNGSYTYLDSEIKDGPFQGSEIPDVPNHKATLGATVDFGRGMTLALTGIYVGERPFVSDFPNDFDDQDDYVVVNAKLKYDWKHLTAFVDVNNLTGNDYAEYGVIGFSPTTFAPEEAFYPSPKINVLFGLSAKF